MLNECLCWVLNEQFHTFGSNFCFSSYNYLFGDAAFCLSTCGMPPFPQIDIIGAVVIVWRVRGKLSGLFCVKQLCTVQCTHMNRPNSSLDLILSHWAHFTVLGFVFTARRSYASAVLGIVILSVCPSVCLSRVCFVTNPKNLPAIFLYHMKTWKGNPSSFLLRKISAKFQRGHPQRGRQIEVGWLKRRFSTIISLYLTNGAK